LFSSCSTTGNNTQTEARCSSDDQLAEADESTRPRLFGTGCAQDAEHQHHHHHHHSVLRHQSSSRRNSGPPCSTLRPSTDHSGPRTEETSTTNSDRRHQHDSQEMSTLLSAVENLLHRALVRSVFTARRYASAVYAVILCVRLFVRPSVCHKSEFYKDG